MLFAATSDIHWHKKLKPFRENLKEIKKPDVLLLAGDITQNGKVEGIRIVEKILKDYDFPVFACFGNEEYNEIHDQLLSIESIIYLDDEAADLKIDDQEFTIIGSRGSLDRPTYWQRNNIPGIKKEYETRVERIRELLRKNSESFRVLFMHYAPTYETVKVKRSRGGRRWDLRKWKG